MFQRIMLAYDESEEAAHALHTAISLALCFEAELTVVSIVEPMPFYTSIAIITKPDLPEELEEQKGRELRALQASAVQRAKEMGITARAVLTSGDEVRGITEIARREKADLLIIGLRKHVTFGPLSSTVHHVAQNSPCPVLAVN